MGRLCVALVGFVTVAGCIPISSTAPCRGAAEVEKTYVVNTTCAGGGMAQVRVRNLVVNRRNDCASGCFATASADVQILDGGWPFVGRYYSNCGSNAGSFGFRLPSDEDGDSYCWVGLDHVGEDVACSPPQDAGACTARVSAG